MIPAKRGVGSPAIPTAYEPDADGSQPRGDPTNQSIGFVLGYLTTRRACNNIFKGGGSESLFDGACLLFIVLQLAKVDKVVVAIVVVCAGEVEINYHSGHLLPLDLPSFEGGYLGAVALKN